MVAHRVLCCVAGLVVLGCLEDEPVEAEFRNGPPQIPHQITVTGDTRPDPTDPELLQVPAPKGKEEWVVANALALVEAEGIAKDDMVSVVQAQQLFATLAQAVDAGVMEVSAVTADEANESITIEYASVEPWMGDLPKTVRRQIDANDVCGGPPPPLGTRWLVLTNHLGAPMMGVEPLPVEDGVVGVSPSAQWSTESLSTCLEEVPA